MQSSRLLAFSVVALTAAAFANQSTAAENVYGNWTPAHEYQNRVVMPEMFAGIDKETNGADQMEAHSGRSDRRRQDDLHRGQGRPDASRAGHRHLCAELHPVGLRNLLDADLRRERSGRRHRRRDRNDLPALPVVHRGVQEVQRGRLGGWTSSAYFLACREPIKTYAELKGKRVRATGGNAEMLKLAGMVPIGATLIEAVGLLQRGGLDCQHGIDDWLRTFGYGDFAKYVMDAPLGLSGPADRHVSQPRHLEGLHARAEARSTSNGPPGCPPRWRSATSSIATKRAEDA